jgi:hypothetical protein
MSYVEGKSILVDFGLITTRQFRKVNLSATDKLYANRYRQSLGLKASSSTRLIPDRHKR